MVFIPETVRKVGPPHSRAHPTSFIRFQSLPFWCFSCNYPFKVAVVKAIPPLLPPEAACLGSTPGLAGEAMHRKGYEKSLSVNFRWDLPETISCKSVLLLQRKMGRRKWFASLQLWQKALPRICPGLRCHPRS